MAENVLNLRRLTTDLRMLCNDTGSRWIKCVWDPLHMKMTQEIDEHDQDVDFAFLDVSHAVIGPTHIHKTSIHQTTHLLCGGARSLSNL